LPGAENDWSISPSLFLFGLAAIVHYRNLATRSPLPRIYTEPIRRTSPELTLQELVNNSSTKIGLGLFFGFLKTEKQQNQMVVSD
jgi:hypothetical protein